MAKRLIQWALTFVVIWPTTIGAQPEIRKLELATYLELESVTDPQLSPNGSQVVYTRQWFDKINGLRKSSLWIVNRDGSRNRFLVDGSSPKWSPRGDRRPVFFAPAPP